MKKGISRRNLFKHMAIGGAAVTTASCQKKTEKLIPLLISPDNFEYTPHRAYQYMTTCKECDAGCGMMITTREGRAQKAEGNPNHPMNRGALCARGQASLQALYNPNRVKSPQNKSGALSWDDAIKLFSEKLNSASGEIVYLGNPSMGTKEKFLDQWLSASGGRSRINYRVFNYSSLKKANQICFEREDIPVYAFEKANYLLNFSADFIETWGNIVENSQRFTEMHAYTNGHKNKFVHVGPHVSLSGGNADEWVVINPGTEGLLALVIANIIRKQNNSHENLASFLEDYTPEKVSSQIGIKSGKIHSLAEDFMKNSPSLAIGGGNVLASEHKTETLVAINILNAVAGNIGETIQFLEQETAITHSQQDLLQLVDDLNKGSVKVLIVDNVNPVYSLPASAKLKEAMNNAYVISLSSEWNETTSEADLILPTLTPYESWGDTFSREGIRSISQPVMVPVNLFDARPSEDILLAVSKQINPETFGVNSYLDYLKEAWREIQQETGDETPFNEFWIKTLEDGGLFTEPTIVSAELQANVTELQVMDPELEGSGLTVLPSTSVLKGDGSGANKPWLQEVAEPVTQIVWDSWVEINPETAKKLGIKDRDIVEVSTPYGKINATAYYHFGIHRDAIAIPFGQGHTNSGNVADGFGVNVLDLLPAKTDSQSGELAWLSVRANVKTINHRSYTVNLDGNQRQLGRNIAAATTVGALSQGDETHGEHHRPHQIVEFYPPHSETAGYYKPYRWGMTIDLDRCNGCSACVVACYAENNIPVVGKVRTAIGREMSWMRIERYIENYGDEFELRFAPMVCQHCENAGCEPVCPVYATYHTPEGLNAQVYNRCVGVRYCSNNCAYKARRFNWFSYEYPEPLNQQLNSTITTRDVGVMEKCTFCIQRIREAQDAARELGRDVQDGEVITACQQTCPTKAITFGNYSNENSEVSQMAKRNDKKHRDRQYEIFEELNFKPGITYLKKVNLRETRSGKHAPASSHG